MNLSRFGYIVEEFQIQAREMTRLNHFRAINVTNNVSDDAVPAVSASLASTRLVVQTFITPIVVTVGLLGNLLNVLVLVQPTMRTSTNVYLLTLAMADIVYLVFSFALSFVGCRRRGLGYVAYAFNTYGRTICDMSGNIAVWIVVIFTVERYLVVCHPMYGKVWCTVKRAKVMSLAAVVFCAANTIPGFFELEIVHTPEGPRCRYTSFASTQTYELGYTWWYVTIFSFLPLAFLLFFNSLLIRVLIKAARVRESMLVGGSTVSRDSPGGEGSRFRMRKKPWECLCSAGEPLDCERKLRCPGCWRQNSTGSVFTCCFGLKQNQGRQDLVNLTDRQRVVNDRHTGYQSVHECRPVIRCQSTKMLNGCPSMSGCQSLHEVQPPRRPRPQSLHWTNINDPQSLHWTNINDPTGKEEIPLTCFNSSFAGASTSQMHELNRSTRFESSNSGQWNERPRHFHHQERKRRHSMDSKMTSLSSKIDLRTKSPDLRTLLGHGGDNVADNHTAQCISLDRIRQSSPPVHDLTTRTQTLNLATGTNRQVSRQPSVPQGCVTSFTSLSHRSRDRSACSRKWREQQRVTLMLTVIVVIFLCCQLPWTVLYLYRAYLSTHHDGAAGSDDIKIAGNVVNLLAQMNASGNFYLYSFFSRKFRRTLARLCLFRRGEPSSPSAFV